jgi:hypothetical protein
MVRCDYAGLHRLVLPVMVEDTRRTMGRWVSEPTLLLLVILCSIAIISLIIAPVLSVVTLGAAVLLLLWERYRLGRAMRALANRLQSGTLETKLEVGVGAWGEVCHAMNRLLQRWRAEQHLQRLQPSQPALQQLETLTILPPVEGKVTPIAVVAVGQLAFTDPLAELRARTQILSASAAHQRALVQWHDGVALLIVGVLIPTPDPIRSAVNVITTIVATAKTAGLPLPPFALSSGNGRVAIVPLLGLYVTGDIITQTAQLVVESSPGTLVCTEEAGMQLRSIAPLPLPLVPVRTATYRWRLAASDEILS